MPTAEEYARDPAKYLEKRRKYYDDNKAKVLKQNKEYIADNREANNKYQNEYRIKNYEKSYASERARYIKRKLFLDERQRLFGTFQIYE